MKRWKQLVLVVFLNFFQSMGLCAPLEHMTVIHPVLGLRDVAYEAVNGYAVTEDDIILTPLQSASQMPKASILKLASRRWAGGVIPYEIDKTLPLANKEAVIAAIQLWEQASHVTFVLLTPENREKYPDYVAFIPEGGRICASYVGRFGGRQIVQLSSRCTTMITVHEIGHVLGLWHEQSRLDRDGYIRIMWENIDEHSKYNFEQHLTDGLDYGPYNYQSIMHYSAYAFSKNGEKTIVPLIEGVEIGQRDEISPLDIIAIDSMYPSKLQATLSSQMK
jgi:hypothetical protein